MTIMRLQRELLPPKIRPIHAPEPEMPPAWFAVELLIVAGLAVAAVIWGVRPYLVAVVWIARNWL